MRKVFVSYSRKNKSLVYTLIEDLKALEYQIWFDAKQSGGQIWWTEILNEIRECDIFIFALTPEALNSQACKLEYEYGYKLNKKILPILLSEGVSTNLLPPDLATIQFVDYKCQDRHSLFTLVKALNNLPKPDPLPEPLPEAPEAPLSHLTNLKVKVETDTQLSFEEQTALYLKIKERLSNSEDFEDAIKLLKRLNKREDLFASVSKEIEAVISSEEGKNVSRDFSEKKQIGKKWSAELVHNLPENNRTIRIILTDETHLVEYKTGWGEPVVIVDGNTIEHKRVSFLGPLCFNVSDGSSNRSVNINSEHGAFISHRITRFFLSVDNEVLYREIKGLQVK